MGFAGGLMKTRRALDGLKRNEYIARKAGFKIQNES
jgi:hypothetical protein